MATSCTNDFGCMIVKNQFVFQLHHSSLFIQWKWGRENTSLIQKGHLLHYCFFLVFPSNYLPEEMSPPSLCFGLWFFELMLSLEIQISKGPIWSFFPYTIVWVPGFAPKFLDPSSSSFSCFPNSELTCFFLSAYYYIALFPFFTPENNFPLSLISLCFRGRR